MDRKTFTDVNRIVIKLGTNVIRADDGSMSLPRIFSFIENISALVKAGKEVIVITSGAVGMGKKRLGLDSTTGTALKQACAAIGQSKLMAIYESGFDSYGLVAAQILLTEDDFSIRTRYLSLRTTMNKLLELGVTPIINQNDTVSTIEIAPRYADMQVCFSDNDKLSALVASELDADLLIILSDVDGLYDKNPKENPDAKIISKVEEVTDEILALGSGASEGSLSDKKRWIGYATNIIGKIIVNDGAKKALINQKSLLPIGVVGVVNEFNKGDVVSIVDEKGNEFARGIVNYSSESCKKVSGAHSDDLLKILGFKNYDAIITRDNITVL